MTKTWMRAALLGSLLGAATTYGAMAHDYKLGELTIGHPWTRATASGQPSAGAFLVITNNGTEADRLVSASSPLAKTAELHSMTVDNGVMKMRALPDGLDLPPGKTVELMPGSLHIMLVGPTTALAEGQRVPLSLTFQKAGTIDVELAVEKAGAKSPAPAMSHDHKMGG
jgi:copper(I)-binding protein